MILYGISQRVLCATHLRPSPRPRSGGSVIENRACCHDNGSANGGGGDDAGKIAAFSVCLALWRNGAAPGVVGWASVEEEVAMEDPSVQLERRQRLQWS